MSRTAWVIGFVLVAGCSAAGEDPPGGEPPGPDAGIAADAAGAPDAPGLDGPDAAPPDTPVVDPRAPGPYPVGVRTVEVVDTERSRSFLVDVWYPSLGDGSPNRYELPPLATIETDAGRDATAAAGDWPLVVFSHGYGGIRFQSYFLTEHLASHGFVVASPDHPGNTLFDAIIGGDDAAAQSAIDRPLDVQTTLDAIIGASFVDVDPDRVGVSGHSFGGWTALEVARRDARFGAVLPLAPGFKQGATPDFVAELARPLCIFGGSVDGTTPFDSDQLAPYDLAAEPKYLVRVTGAGHLDFSNLCEVPVAPLFVDDGCDPASIDPAVVHDRVRAVATAFALRHVAGDDRYAPYLEADYVVGLGDLDYWSAQ